MDLLYKCELLRACKPPYKCPVEDCGRVYKTYSGIEHHVMNFDHTSVATPGQMSVVGGGRVSDGGLMRVRGERAALAGSQSLLHSLSQDMDDDRDNIEVEIGGRVIRVDINEPLKLMIDNDVGGGLGGGGVGCVEGEQTSSGRKEGLSPGRLPDVQYRIVQQHAAVPLTVPTEQYEDTGKNCYHRHIDETCDDADNKVCYDLDEEDEIWLNMINKNRLSEGLNTVSNERFEELMDRLERISYLEPQRHRSMGTEETVLAPRDEDAVCCVCLDGSWHINNVILFCDLCNIPVHQECYGVPHIPDGPWLCRRCLLSPSRPIDCCLCPSKQGAMKQTENSDQWAHVVCASWVPETGFANQVFLEPIDGIERIAPARWKLTCYICKERGSGACIQCHKPSCYTAFHVTCALDAGLYMKVDPMYYIPAVRHSSASHRAGKQSEASSCYIVPSVTVTNIRKTAYCDVHSVLMTKSGGEETGKADDDDEDVDDDDDDSVASSLPAAEIRARSRIRLKKARKAVAEGRCSGPILSVPVIKMERLEEMLLEMEELEDREQLLIRLISYWRLKRHSRAGVPLIKLMNVPHGVNIATDKDLSTDRSSLRSSQQVSVKKLSRSSVKAVEGGGVRKRKVGKVAVESEGSHGTERAHTDEWKSELRLCRRLRQELEKVRLLNELIRKREKLKLEQVRVIEREIAHRLQPLQLFLLNIVDLIISTAESLHLTSQINKLRELRERIEGHEILTVNELSVDINSIINSTAVSSSKNLTIFNKKVSELMHEATEMCDRSDYDVITGLHSSTLSVTSSYADDGAGVVRAYQGSSVTSTDSSDVRLSSRRGSDAASAECRVECTDSVHERGRGGLSNKRNKKSPHRASVSDSHRVSESERESERETESDKRQTRSSHTTLSLDHPSPANPSQANPSPASPSPASPSPANPGPAAVSPARRVSVIKQLALTKAGVSSKSSLRSEQQKLSDGSRAVRSGAGLTAAAQKHIAKAKKLRYVKGRQWKGGVVSERVGGGMKCEGIKLSDVVWAKCRGYPSYPALVVNASTPDEGLYVDEDTIIPCPPQQVVQLSQHHSKPHLLVLFFDNKRTWQWVKSTDVKPLGEQKSLDDSLLNRKEGVKLAMSKAIKVAYKRAIELRERLM